MPGAHDDPEVVLAVELLDVGAEETERSDDEAGVVVVVSEEPVSVEVEVEAESDEDEVAPVGAGRGRR